MCFKNRGRDFEKEKLLKILNDKYFTGFLEEVLKKKKEYKNLNLPNMNNLLKNIKDQISRI